MIGHTLSVGKRRMERIRTLVFLVMFLMGSSINIRMEIEKILGSSSQFSLATKKGWMERLGRKLTN
jgi:hypothetical protein